MREMKDSGIAWVGEIPKEWSVNRAKYCFINTKEIAGCRADDYERLALTMNGVVKRSKDDSTLIDINAQFNIIADRFSY